MYEPHANPQPPQPPPKPSSSDASRTGTPGTMNVTGVAEMGCSTQQQQFPYGSGGKSPPSSYYQGAGSAGIAAGYTNSQIVTTSNATGGSAGNSTAYYHQQYASPTMNTVISSSAAATGTPATFTSWSNPSQQQKPPPPLPPPPSTTGFSRGLLDGQFSSHGVKGEGGQSQQPPQPQISREAEGGLTQGQGQQKTIYRRDEQSQQQNISDPGDTWLPIFLKDKSKSDLTILLSSPLLLNALTNSSQTIHPSLSSSLARLREQLEENLLAASELVELEEQLSRQRAGAQAQLLAAHALERQWRQKQLSMENTVLDPFSPSSLYQRLSQGVAEQEAVCVSLEDSLLNGGGTGAEATEREVLDWIRQYRDTKRLYYLRRERKARWDEGRVGGWR